MLRVLRAGMGEPGEIVPEGKGQLKRMSGNAQGNAQKEKKSASLGEEWEQAR
jgi:hypothetical protein